MTPETPGEAPISATMETLRFQGDMLSRVAEKLKAMETNSAAFARRSEEESMKAEAIREARMESRAERSWEAMRQRIDSFEKILREDKAGGEKSAEKKNDESPGGLVHEVVDTAAVAEARDSPGGFVPPEVLSVAPGGSDAHTSLDKGLSKTGGGPAVMSVLIKKLQGQTQTAQEIYVQALADFREVDEEMWFTHFPPGYRERIAPQFLGELYAAGKPSLKIWAKDWLKEKSLGIVPKLGRS